ncbi:MAG: hypothetical protein NTZ73_03405 [Candidatus Diapherotrites archaeon]|nr:hypothetical protein [Candidatus Diapherotrites archaeon]
MGRFWGVSKKSPGWKPVRIPKKLMKSLGIRKGEKISGISGKIREDSIVRKYVDGLIDRQSQGNNLEERIDNRLRQILQRSSAIKNERARRLFEASLAGKLSLFEDVILNHKIGFDRRPVKDFEKVVVEYKAIVEFRKGNHGFPPSK